MLGFVIFVCLSHAYFSFSQHWNVVESLNFRGSYPLYQWMVS